MNPTGKKAKPRLTGELSLDSGMLADALDPGATLRSLLLSLMSRLLTTRGLAARCGEEDTRVEAAFGTDRLATGDVLAIDLQEDRILKGEDVPEMLREEGLSLLVPLRYNGQSVGLIALGPRADARPFSRKEVAVARSLAGVAAMAIQATRTGRTLAGRVQDLQTLLEVATAFGECREKDEIASRLTFAAMGRWMTRRAVVAFASADRPDAFVVSVARGWNGLSSIPASLAEKNKPSPIDDPALQESGLEWSIPLRAGDTVRGVLLLGGREGERPYPASDSAFAVALAALAVGALEALDRIEERVAHERLEQEMRLARRIQEQLLPREIPSLPGFDVAAAWRPGTTVSGDFYDVARLDEDRIVFAIADGMGHGAPAALLAATLQSGLRLLRQDALKSELDLASVTSRLNTLICESTHTSQFVTLAWGVLEADGTVHYVTAGHVPPRRTGFGGGGALSDGGPLLGVMPDAAYQTGTSQLEPGDRLVLFTDGISEAENHDGKQFGTDGIDEVMAASASEDADTAVASLIEEVEAFRDPSREVDDLTVMVIHREARGK